MTDGPGKHKRMSVFLAVAIGLLWVNGPIFPLGVGIPAGMIWLIYRNASPEEPISAIFAIPMLLSGFVAAWLWWSFNVPRWRLWAYERIADIKKLNRWAVRVGLIWPPGHFLERTEIKSKEHRDRERELESA